MIVSQKIQWNIGEYLDSYSYPSAVGGSSIVFEIRRANYTEGYDCVFAMNEFYIYGTPRYIKVIKGDPLEYELSPKSKYMLICSDGIWEFISNEEAMEIGNKFYLLNDPLGLCHKLKNESTKIWINEDIFIDDITVVVVFF